MIRQRIYIEEYDILVHAYYAVTQYYTEEILDRLYEIGCRGYNLEKAENNISANKLDTGLTYYSARYREAVMVIGLTSSAAELFNSLMHELSHLTAFIAKDENLSFTGERIAYLEGELARDIFPKIQHLLCDCCRNKEYDYE
jgi:broad-specificity NMP kinase